MEATDENGEINVLDRMLKRGLTSAGNASAKAVRRSPVVDPQRLRRWKEPSDDSSKPVIYWMARDRRVADNWALLYAMEEAQRTRSPLAVAFSLVQEGFLETSARHLGFMLRGMKLMEPKLQKLNIPFFLFQGEPQETLPQMAARCQARLIVMDYSPLRRDLEWKRQVMEAVECGMEEVDAHNIVPVWVASPKREHAAYTLRPKLNSKLHSFLTSYAPLKALPENLWPEDCMPEAVDWDGLLEEVLERGAEVPEVTWLKSGEDEGRAALDAFLQQKRLASYAEKRNDPTQTDGQSGLSPYFHFGFLSPQRAAFEARKHRNRSKEGVDQFLEEMIIRRELSENFCHYEPEYDSLEVALSWAKTTLQEHLADEREHLYTRAQLEMAETHEDLWNACQKELIYAGKLHGYMRMYWAKQILAWTATPADALEISIYLNDKYSLDGTDPNGYTGCQWSIAGIHDRAFRERPVSGKIRPMTYSGCKRKFRIEEYIARIHRMEQEAKANTT